MAVPFSNVKIRVPHGFQGLLEAFITEVLRQQPENIYEFGALYFEEMISERERTGIEDVTKLGHKLQDRFYNMPFKRITSEGDHERANAALKIQTEYRRHEAESEVKHMRHEQAGEHIQAALEGHADREHQHGKIELPEEIRAAFGDDADPEEMTKAALKIQAGFKGLKVRRQIREQLDGKDGSKADEGESHAAGEEVEDHVAQDPSAEEAETGRNAEDETAELNDQVVDAGHDDQQGKSPREDEAEHEADEEHETERAEQEPDTTFRGEEENQDPNEQAGLELETQREHETPRELAGNEDGTQLAENADGTPRAEPHDDAAQNDDAIPEQDTERGVHDTEGGQETQPDADDQPAETFRDAEYQPEAVSQAEPDTENAEGTQGGDDMQQQGTEAPQETQSGEPAGQDEEVAQNGSDTQRTLEVEAVPQSAADDETAIGGTEDTEQPAGELEHVEEQEPAVAADAAEEPEAFAAAEEPEAAAAAEEPEAAAAVEEPEAAEAEAPATEAADEAADGAADEAADGAAEGAAEE